VSESFHGNAPPPKPPDVTIQPAEARPKQDAALAPHLAEEASRPKLTWRRALRSRWLRLAAFFMAITLVFIAVNATSDASPWVLVAGFLGTAVSLGVALFGLAELSRKRSPRRDSPAPATAARPDVTYRWGRTIFQAAAILTAAGGVISVGGGIMLYGPWEGLLIGFGSAVCFLVLIAFLAFILYAVVMGPRVAYYRIASLLTPPFPGEEAATKAFAPETTDRPDPSREQSIKPAVSTDIRPGEPLP
jgi:hypothetical protein